MGVLSTGLGIGATFGGLYALRKYLLSHSFFNFMKHWFYYFCKVDRKQVGVMQNTKEIGWASCCNNRSHFRIRLT